MSYDTWISGIYDTYDGTYKYWECQDEIDWLQQIIQRHKLRDELWDAEGEYKWKSKEVYEGYELIKTTEGKRKTR